MFPGSVLKNQYGPCAYRWAKGRPIAQLLDVQVSDANDLRQVLGTVSSRTQELMPAPSLTDGAHGVSVLARKVICDVHIS